MTELGMGPAIKGKTGSGRVLEPDDLGRMEDATGPLFATSRLFLYANKPGRVGNDRQR